MRNTMLTTGVLFLISAFVPVAVHAAAIDGAGSSPTCPARGKIKLKPALVTGGSEAGIVKVIAKSSAECSGGTGDGSTIVLSKAKGVGTTSANTCALFGGAESSDVALKLKWKVAKGSPKLNPSTATFSLQPGDLAPNGNQTFELTGTITAGSFVGSSVAAHIESEESAATLLAGCGDKGIKKVPFGNDGQTSSCMNGPDLGAAITKQITTIDSNDVPHLELQLTTVTNSPFQLTETDLTTSAPGILLESVGTICSLLDGDYRCRHTAFYVSTGGCQWDGNYDMDLAYSCDPTNACDLCGGSITVPMTLDSENFCNATTVFCTADLSCADATSESSTGGVPCCSATYTPLTSCLSDHCSTDCETVIAGEGGIIPSSPCDTCALNNCSAEYSACSADNEVCAAE